jgi:anti-sigma factor RsiW
MSGRHVSALEVESYVLGMLDASRVEEFEAHCSECDACAAALAGEAQLEVAFEQVARQPARMVAPRSLRTAAYGAAGAAAMAAAVLLWFGHTAASTATASDGSGTASAAHHPMDDGAILDARNDALDGG